VVDLPCAKTLLRPIQSKIRNRNASPRSLTFPTRVRREIQTRDRETTCSRAPSAKRGYSKDTRHRSGTKRLGFVGREFRLSAGAACTTDHEYSCPGYGLTISEVFSSFLAFCSDRKYAKLFCTIPVRKETSSGPESPSPAWRATASASFATSGRPVSTK